MRQRATPLCFALIAVLALSGPAAADGARARTVQLLVNTEQTQSAARPANTVSIAQQGRGNAGSIVQTGSGNTAGLRQFGRANTGAIVQLGSGNTACLIQAGRNLDGAIEQVGDNQTSGLIQTRWGTSEIPVEVCTTATTRAEVMAYAPPRPEPSVRSRARGRLRGEP